jgi:hypothetical protein
MFPLRCIPSSNPRALSLHNNSSNYHGALTNIRRSMTIRRKGFSFAVPNRPSNLRRRNARVRPNLLRSGTTGEPFGPYGLHRVDYTVVPPAWPLPPPPPPSTNPLRRNLPYMLPVGMLAICVWIYMVRDDETVNEYWRQVEQGGTPGLGDEDGDDDDEEDEWADDSHKSVPAPK